MTFRMAAGALCVRLVATACGSAGPSGIESAETPAGEPQLELDAVPGPVRSPAQPTPTAPPGLAKPDRPLDLGGAGTIPVLDLSTLLVDAATVVFDTFDGDSATLAKAGPDTIVGLIDAIAPIDAPDYLFGPQASWLTADDVVIGYVDPAGDPWAFPVKILNFHEILNDQFAGLPVLVSYCPLCGSGVIFDRRLDGDLLSFSNTVSYGMVSSMPRITPPDRLEKLVAVSAEIFVERGYRLTQMDDIADRLGVSKGTLYRHVDSKASLFAGVVRHGDDPASLPTDGMLASVGLDVLVERMSTGAARMAADFDIRVAAATHEDNFGDAVEQLAMEMYNDNTRLRIAIMVFDRCASEIAPEWFELARYAVVDAWTRLLDDAAVESAVDPATLARTIVELVTLWSVKMPWDPAPRAHPADAEAVGAMVRSLVVGAQK